MRMSRTLFTMLGIFLIGGRLSATLLPDLNTVSGKEFVRLSRLRTSPALFERIRRELGGFEDPRQLVLLFRVPENRIQHLTNTFVCRTHPDASHGFTSDQEWTSDEDLDPDPIPLAACTPTRLETIPGISPLMAGRIAKTCRLVSTRQRWQLLGVRGMTPSLYGRIRRYIEPERRTESRPWKFAVRTAARSSKNGWSIPAHIWLDCEDLELRTAARADSGATGRRISGNFGLPALLPRPLASLAGYLRLDLGEASLILGHYRLRSPLGLLAGRPRPAGEIRLEEGSQPGFIPTASSLSPAVTSGAACEYQSGPCVITAAAGLTAQPLKKNQIENGRISTSLSSLFAGEGDTPVRHARLGLGASWQPVDWGRLSALWLREYYEYDFILNRRRPEFTASIRDRLLLATGVQAGACLFSGEFVSAFEGGDLSGPQAWGAAGGISLAEGDTRAGLVFHTRSRIHPGVLDGLASGLSADEGITLELRTRLDEDLSLEGGLSLQGRTADGWKSAGRIESDWRITRNLRLGLRLAEYSDEEGATTRKGDIRLEVALGRVVHFIWSAGLRSTGRADGGWLAALLELDLAGIRIRTGYADWLAGQGISLWPARPVLAQAGDGLLAGVSGAGRTAGIALEGPATGRGLAWGGLIRLQEEVRGWLPRPRTTSLDIALYLKLTLGADTAQ